MYLHQIKKIFFFIILIFSTSASSSSIVVQYDIVWNKILLGKIGWEINFNQTNYEFVIELKSEGLAGNFYPFYGKHYSNGMIIGGQFIPKEYYQVWKTKKKNRFISLKFNNKKLIFFEIKPNEHRDPKINLFKLENPKDPVSAALELIIINNEKLIQNIFDGRRTYSMSVVEKEILKSKKLNLGEKIKKYELVVSNYQNVWKDHNDTDLRKVIIETVELENNIIIPLSFKIYNKGLVFNIIYKQHNFIN